MSTPPTNLPPITVNDNLLGPGWRQLGIGEVVPTNAQYYALWLSGGPDWMISSYFTEDGYVNSGKATYRVPVSLKAHLSNALPVARKYSRRFFAWLASVRKHFMGA